MEKNNIPSPEFRKEFHLKGGKKILQIIQNFSATERVVFGFFVVIALVSALIMAWKVNRYFLVPTPSYGGNISEGIIGLPRSINPVLAFTDVDRDLSTLIYSGLMKYKNGTLTTDLANKYSVSEDGLEYTFFIKDSLRFHDGTPITTDDIEFTIQKIQDGELKSPRRADWASVTIKKISSTEIHFILRQPYAPFLTNTTIGIIPKNLWKNLSADQFIFSPYNLSPVGSGPYKISRVKTDSSNIPTEYNLVSFNKHNNKEPYISNINIYFYANEKDAINAYKAGTIDNLGGVSPEEAYSMSTISSKSVFLHSPISRIFGVFFNQNNSPVLANPEVRQALSMAIDRNKIVKEVLYGYGVGIDSPIGTDRGKTSNNPANPDGAKSLLAKSGWIINKDGILEKKSRNGTQILEIAISTADAGDLKKTAEIIKKEWEDLGAKVDIKVFEYGDLSQNIIKTRKYDALLFGEVIGKDLDMYAFWHSSQRNSPGLNVSMYVNSKVDSLLEDMRVTSDDKSLKKIYDSFQKIIKDDVPAVFIYSPEYIYIISDKIKGYYFQTVVNPSDRWNGIDEWFVAEDYVWKIFIKNKN